MKLTLDKALIQLMHHYGPLRWWPAENKIEMMISAILVQNTNWKNVKQALAGFSHPMTHASVLALTDSELIEVIRPAGSYTRKAQAIRHLVLWDKQVDAGSMDTQALRKQLLSIPGIGPETADSILLYGFNRPVFVVDAYLKRLLVKLGMDVPSTYDDIQALCMRLIPADVALYQEMHAAIVEYGKQYLKVKPESNDPLNHPVPLLEIPFEVYIDIRDRNPMFQSIAGYVTRITHPNPYHGFVYTIIGQLLHAKTASTLTKRFLALYPTVQSVCLATLEDIQAVGLTRNKAIAILELCTMVQDHKFDFNEITTMTDTQAIQRLKSLRGIGTWSAVIILIHSYNRLNLSSYDDLALRKSLLKILNIDTINEATFNETMKQFEPYKSVASMFLWSLNKKD